MFVFRRRKVPAKRLVGSRLTYASFGGHCGVLGDALCGTIVSRIKGHSGSALHVRVRRGQRIGRIFFGSLSGPGF